MKPQKFRHNSGGYVPDSDEDDMEMAFALESSLVEQASHAHPDAAASEDLEAVYEMSRQTQNASCTLNSQVSSTTVTNPTSSSSTVGPPPDEQSYIAVKQKLNGRLSKLDAEIGDMDRQITQLQNAKKDLAKEREKTAKELQAHSARLFSNNGKSAADGKGKDRAPQGIDYTAEFDWTPSLKDRMRKVFRISEFRLCQEGVCNASMDSRDIICIMPTGGGKSLTYQLPALLVPGCTIVISPLIALMTDQILHLRENNVEAVMLNSATSKEEINATHAKLKAMASRGKSSSSQEDRDEIKLCYVTPEKIAKSKTFMSILEKLRDGQQLARFVIDEAHCVSSLGHDFRPDYKGLAKLRKHFPGIPILALSATCPRPVLQDLLQTLGLRPTVDGKAANHDGTVHFSAPLYRANLHYAVLPKPSASSKVIQTMCEWIENRHANESGIVYCLSQKDAENVAENLRQTSGGRIRTGVYHAEIRQKDALHRDWRAGKVQVVCATIAFGLGIDKADVRFVIHHSMSKSMDGFYQESGRAGRDGKDADCILFYRQQDAMRLRALTCDSPDRTASQKVTDMTEFAEELVQCRKVYFAKFFSIYAEQSMSDWTTDEKDALERCGHCDNCRRDPDTIEQRDCTLDAWRILQAMRALERAGSQVTFDGLRDIVRGNKGRSGEGTAIKGKRRKKESMSIDMQEVAGGKVDLTAEYTEALLAHLLVAKYLDLVFKTTAYRKQVYLKSGSHAIRLTRLSEEDVASGVREVEYRFRKPARKSAPKSQSKSKSAAKSKPQPASGAGKPTSKRKSTAVDDDDDDEATDEEEESDPKYDGSDSDSDVQVDWSHSLRPNKRPRRHERTSQEVINLLSD